MAYNAFHINLILENFGKKRGIKAIIKQGKIIIQFIYNNN